MNDLGDFFSLIGEEKKKKEEKTQEIIGEISLGDLFSSLSEEKKKVKQKNIEKEKELEKIKRDAKIFESFLFSEVPKLKVKEEEEVIEDTIVLEEPPDIVTEDVVETDPPETVDISDNIKKSMEILEQSIPEEEMINESETEIARLKREMDQLRKMVYESVRTATAQGGGGEVRLEFLDDVDRDSVKQNNKFIKYDSSTGLFVGANASSIVDLGPLTNIAAAATTDITDGFTLVYDSSSGQFIATAVNTNATSLDGFAISGSPSNNDVLAFNQSAGAWNYESPFTIVDLSDSVEDGHQDYGAFE